MFHGMRSGRIILPERVRCQVRKDSAGKVHIAWGTKHIGDEAFMGSRFIADVCIPETVTTIGIEPSTAARS